MIVKDQIKEHYEKYKTIYHIVGTGLVIFTTVIITRRIVRRNDDILRTCIRPMSYTDVHTTKSQNNTASSLFGNAVNNINTYVGSGNTMSKIISCDQTGEWFKSQAEAARYFGISEANLSKHLNKGESIPGVVNLSFSREGIAA